MHLEVKTIKGRRYFYAAQTGRVDGKPRRIKQIYLGTLEDLVAAKGREESLPPSAPTASEPSLLCGRSARSSVSRRRSTVTAPPPDLAPPSAPTWCWRLSTAPSRSAPSEASPSGTKAPACRGWPACLARP